MKLKNKKCKKNNIIFILLVVIITSCFFVHKIGQKVTPRIENIVEIYVNRSVYDYLFNTFDKNVLLNEDLFNVINLNKNEDGEVISVDYKLNLAYEYLSDGMTELYDNVRKLKVNLEFYDSKNNIFFVPVGYIYNNLLLDNLGFKIPCKVVYFSNIHMGFKTKVTSYGVNNLLVELYLVMDVKNNLISPNRMQEFGDSYVMLIASKIVVGKIPFYFGESIEKSSAILSS